MENGVAALENSLAAPQKVKYRVPLWPSSSTPRYRPRRNENISPRQNLFAHVYSSINRNSEKVETTRVSIHWSVEILSIHWNEVWPWEGVKCWYVPQHDGNTLSGGSQTQRATCRVIPLMWTVQHRHIHGDRRGMGGCQGLGKRTGGMRRGCFYEGCVWGFFLGWWQCSEIKQWWWLHNLGNVLKTTEPWHLVNGEFYGTWILFQLPLPYPWIMMVTFSLECIVSAGDLIYFILFLTFLLLWKSMLNGRLHVF